MGIGQYVQKPEAVLPAAPRPPSPTDSYYTIAKRAIARAFSLWTRPPGMARDSLARPRTGPSCDSASFSIWRRLAAAARRTIRPSAPKGTLGCPMSPVRITRSRKFQTHIWGGGERSPRKKISLWAISFYVSVGEGAIAGEKISVPMVRNFFIPPPL